MSWSWVAVPLVLTGIGSGAPIDEAPAIGDNEFVGTCVDLAADDIETASLCVVGLDGSIELLADDLVPGRQIALSGDRTKIAAATSDRVVVVDASGKTQTSVPVAGAAGLAWMPDGASLLVQQLETSSWSVTRHDPGDDHPEEIAAGDVAGDSMRRGITVTPDGTTLVYAERFGDTSTLVAVDIATGQAMEVYSSGENLAVPDASPDGELLAAVVGRRIEVIDLDNGRVVRSIEQDNAVTTPSFSPDGSQLMYVEARGAVEYQDLDDDGSDRVVVDITRDDDSATFPANPTWS